VNLPQPILPFLATLHFPNLSGILNDPIYHDPHSPPMITKFPSDIPNFEGKLGKYPGDHVMSFHLWFSSNLLKDDYVQLCLFQCNLIGGAMKWYIKLNRLKYAYFNDLDMVLLNHFHLLVIYDVSTKLLSNFEKMKFDHISDHIRKWQQ
jgi:hypothetical protein